MANERLPLLACVWSGVIHMCQICGGIGRVKLPLLKESRYITLDDDVPEVGPVTFKEYLCPECQPVFYLSDLQQVHAGSIHPNQIVETEKAVFHVWNTLARRIGSHLEPFLRKRKKFDDGHTTAFEGSVWVLRPEAQRKLYRSEQ